MEDITRGGMYLVIPASVAEDVRLRERSKLIYGRIVQLASSTGFCYASNQALLEILSHEDPKTGEVSVITERTLQNALAELRDRGHIHMDEGPVPCSGGEGTVVRRRIFVGRKLADMPPPQGGAENFTPENFCTPGVKKISPPLNSKNNTSKNIPPIVPHEILRLCEGYAGEDAQLLDALLGLLENRAAANKSPVKTTRAMNGILHKLDKLSGGDRGMKLALLEKATVSNWLTVYPLKPDELPARAGAYDDEGEDGI